MRRTFLLLPLLFLASGAPADPGYDRARALGLEILMIRLAGDTCSPGAVADGKRQELRTALSAVTTPGLGDTTGLGPLNLAVMVDDVPALVRLAALGYPLRDPEHLLLHEAALHDARQSLAFLLQQGADANDTNAYGATALMTAAASGRLEVARALLSAGASPLARTGDGGTALHYAIGCRDQAMVDLLAAAGAEIDARARALAQRHGLNLPSHAP